MTDSIDPDTLKDPCDAAAYWFARERSGDMGVAERQRFEAWRLSDPRHEQEYRRAKGIWNTARLIPADRLRELAREPAAGGLPRPRRRQLSLGLGAAACAAAVAGGIVLPRWLDATGDSTRFATGHGERRQVSLPDDSVIDLNTDTALSVRFQAGRRVVELAAGEAVFTVAHDPARPFYVEAGRAIVRVTGTRFGVRLDGGAARVSVESGTVEVRDGPWWRRERVVLGAGQSARRGAGSALEAGNADVQAMLAWRQGRIVFDNISLAEAVGEINRYAPRAIVLGDAALASVRIAGVFSTDDTAPFLDLLPDIAPVTVRYRADGAPVVVRR